jgi:hypothetical protein
MNRHLKFFVFCFLISIAAGKSAIAQRDGAIKIGAIPAARSAGDFKIADVSAFENSAQVIAPGANLSCSDGRVVLSTGAPVGIYTRSLNNPAAAPVKSKDIAVADGWLGTDNVLTKMADGSLLLVRNGVSWKDVANKPKWWSKYKVQNNPYGSRVVAFAFRSTDCGATWTQLATIDPLDFQAGKYAVPRPLNGDFGGWDRPEVYVDPWNGNIYVTENAAAGVTDANGSTQKTAPDKDGKTGDVQVFTHFLFKSDNGGKSWVKIHEFGAWTPIVMTSTPNGRLVLYSAMGDQPKIKFSARHTDDFTDWMPVNYKLFGKADIAAAGNPLYGCAVYKATNSISRASFDKSSAKVRITYSIVNGFNQTGIAVAQIDIADNDQISVKPIALLYGKNNQTTSILSSGFIEPDAPTAAKMTNAKSVLYWTEAEAPNPPKYTKDADGKQELKCSAFSGTVAARYFVIDSDKALGVPTSEPLSKTETGAPRTWTIANLNGNGRFYGDYAYGGAFWANGRINFLGQWRESDSVRAAIVSLAP